MNTGKTRFSQIMEFLPLYEFQKCVERYQGNYKEQEFSCLDQFLCMAFAQLTYRESLRDIESCLRSMTDDCITWGFAVLKSHEHTSQSQQNQDWRIYADFAQVLIHRAREFYLKEPLG